MPPLRSLVRMPAARLPRAVRSILPYNLMIFDGKCNMCIDKVERVAERNFTFSALDDAANDDALVKNRIFFASFKEPEGKELRRIIFPMMRWEAPGTARGKAADAVAQRYEDNVFLMYIERVPSARRVAFERRHRGRGLGSLVQNDISGTGSSGDANTPGDDYDIMITTQGTACARVFMHLDRVPARIFGRFLYYCVPSAVLDWWFSRFLQWRRTQIWGQRDTDITRTPNEIKGMNVRLWKLGRGPSIGKYKY